MALYQIMYVSNMESFIVGSEGENVVVSREIFQTKAAAEDYARKQYKDFDWFIEQIQ